MQMSVRFFYGFCTLTMNLSPATLTFERTGL